MCVTITLEIFRFSSLEQMIQIISHHIRWNYFRFSNFLYRKYQLFFVFVNTKNEKYYSKHDSFDPSFFTTCHGYKCNRISCLTHTQNKDIKMFDKNVEYFLWKVTNTICEWHGEKEKIACWNGKHKHIEQQFY